MRPTNIRSLAILLLLAGACSTRTDQATPSESEPTVEHAEVNVIEAVAHTVSGELDIYTPLTGESWPVVLLFHGYPPPSRDPLGPLAETLASRGVLVMNVGWRSGAVARDSIAEIGCAVKFARSKATDYGGDSNRITIVGYSAGATASVAVALAGDQFRGDCAESEGSPFPDAFVGIAGFYDPEVTPSDARSRIKARDPDLYQLLNPMNHLGQNLELEIALIHGSNDGQAPVETSTQFHEALIHSGYETTLVTLDGLGHGDVLESHSTVETILDVATSEQLSSEQGSTDGKTAKFKADRITHPISGILR